MYKFVYCLKLTDRSEITIEAHVFVLINRGKGIGGRRGLVGGGLVGGGVCEGEM